MKRCSLLVLLTAFVSLLCGAELPPPAGYKYLKTSGGLVFSDDFAGGLGAWKEWKGRTNTYRIVSGVGDNGSAGVVFERKRYDQGQSLLCYWLDTKPGDVYLGRVQCKIENFSSKKVYQKKLFVHVLAASHYDKDGKLCGENYPRVMIQGRKNIPWGEEKIEFSVPPRTVRTAVALAFCGKNMIGKVTYDNFSLEKHGVKNALIYPIVPKQFVLGSDGRMKFRIHDFSGRPENTLRFCVRIDGKEYFCMVKKSVAALKVKVPAPGKHKVTVFLLDEKQKTVAGTETYTFRVIGNNEKAPAGAAAVDIRGRIKVDGKNFLPVGIFCGSRISKDDVQRIKSGGFNYVMPYKSLLLDIDAGAAAPNSVARVKRSLDYMQKHGMKVMFCLYEQVRRGVRKFDDLRDPMKIAVYAVQKFHTHPAILGWYLSDENRLSDMPSIRKMRETFAAVDPWHPSFTLTNKPDHHLFFGPTGDVLMPDEYPIFGKESTSMSRIRQHFKTAADAGMCTWFVPQAFHWGAYRTKEKYDKFRYPTELEMRSMVLLAMNLGTGGYCFYSYNPIFQTQEKFDPGSSMQFWPQVCNVAKMLRELEEFFFTDDVKTLKCRNNGKNLTEAKLYTSGKKHCVVITCDGPGKAETVFRVPGDIRLRSRYGFTVQQPDGSYKFTGNDIGSDILIDF